MNRALVLLLLCGSAHAEFWDGNKLLSRMDTGVNYYDQGTSMGYIMGVADTGVGIIHCAPANATAGQINDMVKNYLINTPSQRHHSADLLVSRVLKATWPCSERPSGRGV